jgi:5-methylcytosine-specific restriction endonuclease McrA
MISKIYRDPHYADRLDPVARIPIVIDECFYCEDKLSVSNWTRDHVHPKRLGGKFVVPCCKYCNATKGGKTLSKWYSYVEKTMDIYPIEARERRLKKIKLLLSILKYIS